MHRDITHSGNGAFLQWLYFVCIFILDSGEVKWKNKNKIDMASYRLRKIFFSYQQAM